MAFEGTGLLHRSKLDMEMALAASVCHPTLAQATSSKARNDDDDSFLQVIESDDSQSETVKLDGNLDFTVGESSPNNLSSKEICSSKRPRLESDFISLAMLEAKLPSSDADGRGHKCNPVAPKVILPKRIYDILKSHEEGTTAMTSLPAAPLTGWCELMHSSLDPRTIDPVKV
uniref:Uncharacterized protein n=1 Tax=Ciona savignyi TaxID=51511 RepID=H2ZDT1_CIOSA